MRIVNCFFDFVLPTSIAVVLGTWLMYAVQHPTTKIVDANGNPVTCVELRGSTQ